jgi:pimeloyl-ACP methyl ester carboxylesterase
LTCEQALTMANVEVVEFEAPPGVPTGRFVDLPGRGTTFVREIVGPPGAPTLVLLHGWTANSALNWFPAYDALGARFRVLAVDHRGHGNGMRAAGHFRLADCADDVAALCDVLAVDRVIPVGYSMGGPIGQLLWHRHRDRVAGMVLCATSRNFIGRSPAERAWASGIEGLAWAARATPPYVRRRIADRVLLGRIESTEIGMWARQEIRRNDARTLAEAGRALARFSSREWIGEVDVPTAVVITERDLVVPPRRQHNLAASIRGAVAYPVSVGHDGIISAPGLLVPTLVDACADVAGRVRP